MKDLIPVERIAQKIYMIHGQKVMLDSDLAELYDVKTFNLNKAVKRNKDRFPDDFMFQLIKQEYDSIRFQFGMLKRGQHKKYLPYAFTEQGVAMLSSVLRSKKSVMINVSIMRAFVQMREYMATHKQILEKLVKHDENFVIVFKILKQLTDLPKSEIPKKQIGFRP
jgi:phage regulator Rha-like protein